MKNKIALAILGLALVSPLSTLAAPKSEHYIFRYDSGYSFDVTLTDNTITWKVLEGSNKGQTETDYIKRKMLTNQTEVIQWIEKNGTFVTVIFDRRHHEMISSIKNESDMIMWPGTSESV